MCVVLCAPSVACRYRDPSDAAAGDAWRGAASRIVRALLRVAPRDRSNTDAAVAMMEVLLFVMPRLPLGACVRARGDACVCVCFKVIRVARQAGPWIAALSSTHSRVWRSPPALQRPHMRQ